MQCSVSISVELDPSTGVVEWEPVIQAAGWEAMRQALVQAVRLYEQSQPTCPHCGSGQNRSRGTVRRRIRTVFGRVSLVLRRQRCAACQRRFHPAQGCLAGVGGRQVTPALAAACALAGASWPYATAARVLHQLSEAQISAETVRSQTIEQGREEAGTQQAEADRVLQSTAATTPTPSRLLVGLDGGWVPSREQRGGMEGKVRVVAAGSQPVGKHGRQRLTPPALRGDLWLQRTGGDARGRGGRGAGGLCGARATGAGGRSGVDQDAGRRAVSRRGGHPGLGACGPGGAPRHPGCLPGHDPPRAATRAAPADPGSALARRARRRPGRPRGSASSCSRRARHAPRADRALFGGSAVLAGQLCRLAGARLSDWEWADRAGGRHSH